MEISVEEVVSAIFEVMSSRDFHLGPSVLGDFYGEVTHLEEIAYDSFCFVRAFGCSFKLERWQHELLNVVFLTKIAKYCDENKILDCRNAGPFIFGRWSYYYDMWARGIEPDSPPTELPLSLACMLVYHRRYEELATDKEELDVQLPILGAVIMTFTTELIKEFKKEYEDVNIIFDSHDSVRHATYVIRFGEWMSGKKGIESD